MRKQFFALESAAAAKPPAHAYREISLEEEALIMDEAAQDQASIQQDLTEANRVLEVSDALEDVAVVADRIDEASPAEVALIDTASQMAVAGTDVPPEELVPAMEAFLGKKISTESLKETAAKIWDNIQAFITKIWDRIINYFRIMVVVPQLEKRVKAMLENYKKAGNVKADGAEITINTPFLTLDGKAVSDITVLKGALKEFGEASKFVFDTNPEHLAKTGKELAKVFSEFKVTQLAEGLAYWDWTAIEAALSATTHASLPGAQAPKEEGDFKVYMGKPLLGGGALKLKAYDPKENASVLGKMDYFRRSGVEYDNSAGDATGSEVKFKTLSDSEAEELLKEALAMLKTLTDFHNGPRFKALKEAGDAMKAASKKATQQMAHLNTDEGDDIKAGNGKRVSEFRAGLNFNAAFAGWVQNPAIPFCAKQLSVVKAILYLTGMSLKQYEGAEVTKPQAAAA